MRYAVWPVQCKIYFASCIVTKYHIFNSFHKLGLAINQICSFGQLRIRVLVGERALGF